MTDVYNTEIEYIDGEKYIVEWCYDTCSGAPWENSDFHGPVSDWERRAKRPGERILNTDRGARRFYDFQQAMRDAVTLWGCKPGPDAVDAVERDYAYLRAWCNDEWHYCGIVVTLTDDDGEKTDVQHSLWGIESDCSSYHSDVIRELVLDCQHDVRTRTYAGATVGA